MNRQFFLNVLLSLAIIGSAIPAFGVEKGDAVPTCSLLPLDESRNVDLQHYQGRVLYVDFWASWCGPCVKSFPYLNEMNQQLKDQDLQIIAVNLDESLDDAKAFLAQYPANFSVVTDNGEKCAKAFDVKGMPSSYIVDRKGIIRHIEMGFRTGEAKDVRQLIEKLLSENAAEK